MINSFKNNIEIIIYINLNSRIDRKNFMEFQLKNLEIPYERFEAIKPNIENLINGKYKYFFEKSVSRIKNYLLNENFRKRAIGVFGCYLSHYFLQKKAVENKWNNYLVLEDDCKISKKCINLLNEKINKNQIKNDWDIIRNLWNCTNKVKKFSNCNKQSKFSTKENKNEISGGSHFQLCRNTNKILKYFEEDYVYNVDSLLSTNKINSYYCNFGAFIEPFSSDIQV